MPRVANQTSNTEILLSQDRHGVRPRRTRRRSGVRPGRRSERKRERGRTGKNIPQKACIYNVFPNRYNGRMTLTERAVLVEQLLKRRIEAAYPSREVVAERLAGPEKLMFYLGIDPTGSELHIGHTIPLLVLRDLAALGHETVLLIGDFTARIGDPTGKAAARTALSAEDIERNMRTYVQQAQRILTPGSFRVAYNSEWLSTLTMQEVLRLTSMVTVQQMIQRDMFQKRLKEEKPIYLNEFLYPLMQGYDSVALRTDGEVGGNDQTFNMLMGRELSREMLGKDKIVLSSRLLIDASSGKKMSKSEGTLIAVNDTAQEIRRKILATDDGMIRTLFELCTDVSSPHIDEWQAEGEPPRNPREAKEALAAELIRMYHGDEAVGAAADAQEIHASGPLDKTLIEAGVAASASAVRRLVEQGGVQLNGERIERWDAELKPGDRIRVGKGRFLKIK
jgi:tyrosyl-tRNA synthetase